MEDTKEKLESERPRIVGVYPEETPPVLSLRQEAFCQNMAAIGTETYSNGTQSALAAGYAEKSAAVTATKLKKNPVILDRIAELMKEHMQRNNITVDKVLADLEHDKLQAREHGQYSVAVRCDELHGKYLSIFTENFSYRNQIPEPIPMSEEHKQEVMDFLEYKDKRDKLKQREASKAEKEEQENEISEPNTESSAENLPQEN